MNLEELLKRTYGRQVEPSAPFPLKRDLSSRSYYRVTVEGAEPPSLVVMEMSEDPRQSDVHTDEETYAEIPFLNLQRFLAAGGLPVPEVYAEDEPRGLIALEDLGDRTLEGTLLELPRENWRWWYESAVDLIVAFQERGRTHDPTCQAFSKSFDFAQLRWELDHFTEWGLEARGVEVGSAHREVLDRCFDAIAEELASADKVLVHRDFQSRNLMVQGDRLRLIDFQDALLGPRAFDLVCLLCDSYIDVDAETQRAMLDRYARLTGLDEVESTALRRQFGIQTLQRKLKDAGRFVFFQRVKGNDAFLTYFEPSLRYVRRALEELEELETLQEILENLVPPNE